MDQDPARTNLLNRRLALVGKLSGLTSEVLQLSQKIGGAKMEAMRVEMEIGRSGSTDELVRELLMAEEQAEAFETQREACDERIAATEDEVREVDLAIAAQNQAG